MMRPTTPLPPSFSLSLSSSLLFFFYILPHSPSFKPIYLHMPSSIYLSFFICMTTLLFISLHSTQIECLFQYCVFLYKCVLECVCVCVRLRIRVQSTSIIALVPAQLVVARWTDWSPHPPLHHPVHKLPLLQTHQLRSQHINTQTFNSDTK